MAKCIHCGKKGLFLKVDSHCRCKSCAEHLKRKELDRSCAKPAPAKKALFDITIPGETLRYKYTDVKLNCPIVYSSDLLRVGSVCGFFRSSPGSDLIEVSISHGDNNLTIGYFPDGKLRDMAGDWFDRSWTSGGQVSEIRDGNIYINVAFWTPDDER